MLHVFRRLKAFFRHRQSSAAIKQCIPFVETLEDRTLLSGQIVGSQVTGALFLGNDLTTNWFDPANGFVPPLPVLNAAGPTVTISATAQEFGDTHGPDRYSVDFSASQLVIFQQTGTAHSAFKMTFTDSAFLGATLTNMVAGFNFGGPVTATLVGSTITMTWAGSQGFGAGGLAVFGLTPASTIVTTLNDAGPGSFRDVINHVNADPISNGVDPITFASNISGGTISLLSPLPALTRDQVTITGPITVSGTAPGLTTKTSPAGDGLDILANNVTVQQVAFDEFNGDGISIAGNDNTITGNTLAYNIGNGVTVRSGTGNAIHQDLIYGNGGLPIGLGTGGLVPNSVGGQHNGPNNLQNYPIITWNWTSNQVTQGIVQGYLNSVPNTTFTIEIFAVWQQNAVFLESQQVITDNHGNAAIHRFDLSSVTQMTVPFGAQIVATATDPNNNTSEFGLPLTPAQIRTAYGMNNLPTAADGKPLDGTGQTIAIVILYNDPNIFTDVNTFDHQFGINGQPSTNFLTVYNQSGINISGTINTSGQNNVPSTDPTGEWEMEAALDVEWAHTIAPGAMIDLVECDPSYSMPGHPADNGLFSIATGSAAAANQLGASVVSINYTYGYTDANNVFHPSELSSEVSYDQYFNHKGVTFLAATGDYGGPGAYPAYSPNVVAVGGTTLTINPDASYNTEQGWGYPDGNGGWVGSGGGQSMFEPEPAYQLGVQSSLQRTIPDVAFIGGTFVAVANSYKTKPDITYPGNPGWILAVQRVFIF